MNLEPRAVTAVYDVGKRVERGIVAGIIERRLDALRVEGIAAATNLDEECIDVGARGSSDEVVGFAWRTDPFVECVNPERADFGRILRR
jgi:hypothetical protein